MKQAKEKPWTAPVVGGWLERGDVRVRMGCKHIRGTNACGGCYGRLVYALEAIKKRPGRALQIVEEAFAAQKADRKGNGKSRQPPSERGAKNG